MITIETLVAFFNDLKEEGDFDITKPLLYSYFFTDESETKLTEASEVLEKLGFGTVEIFDAEVEDGETPFFYLQVEKVEIHDAETLDLRNKEFYKFVEKYGLESYDGFDLGNLKD